MRIFKAKTFQRICSLVILIAFLVVGIVVMGEALTPISYATYFNHDIKTIEENNQGVGLVFVGASRVFHSYVPEIFEQELGTNCVVNAGSSAQPICGTYYQLKDLVERLHPENVVIGVTWDGIVGDAKPNQQSMLIVYDRLSVSNKIEFSFTNFKTKNLLYCLRPYRYKDNMSWEILKDNYEEKQKLIYNSYVADRNQDQDQYYSDKGFVYFTHSCKTGNVDIRETGIFSTELVAEDKLDYLDACVKLCQEHDIPVYLVSGMSTMMRLYSIENYQEAVDFYTMYAEEKGIIYHNLNYLLDREEIFPDEMMLDYNHLNGEGAYRVSKIYAEILKKDMQNIDTSDYFYEDFDDLKKDVHRIVAVKGDITMDETDIGLAHVVITSLQNEDITPQYQLEISKNDGENYEAVVEWTEESEWDISVPTGQEYMIKVRAKTGNEGDAEAYQIYTF